MALGRCVEDINRTHSDADLCVITGDLTHWGERDAFEHLREHLDKLQIPLRLLLGNHDDRETFRSVFQAQRADENGFIQSVDDFAKERFIYLLIDKKIDADIKPIKKPIQTPTAFNSVYKAKYIITGNPIII